MRRVLGRRAARLTIVVVALFGLAGGIAYATIPGSGQVYTACMLKNVGTVRLIDPSLPASNLMSHCSALEQQITWNQTGQMGPSGPPGKDGTNGTNGVSPTVAQLSAGDSNCPNGGAAITDAAGHTAYACNGQDGANGKPFSGSFTSPSGQFTLSVTDGGITIVGPGTSISLDTSGNLTEKVSGDNTITVGGNRTETVSGNDTVTVSSNRSEKVVGNDKVTVEGNRTDEVTGNESVVITGNRTDKVTGTFGLQAAGALNLSGSFLGLNGSAACKPVARVGDSVDPTSLLITQGSPDVCID